MFARLKRSLTSWRKTRRPEADTTAPVPDDAAKAALKTVDPSLETIESLEDAVVVAKRRDDTTIEARPEEKPETKPAKAVVPAGPVDRASLISQAMRIREEKSSILANLSPSDRARLRALAMKLLVGQPPKPDKLH